LVFWPERKCCVVCKTRGVADHTASTGVLCIHLWTYTHILLISSFLSAFAKLRIVTISYVMFVRLSVHVEQLGFHWMDFNEIWYLSVFRKHVEKMQVLLKSDKNKVYFTWRPMYIFTISHSFIHRMRSVSDKTCR
jgi:hypothetical protein